MKAVRVIIGLLLLPCCLAVSRTVYLLLAALGHNGGTGAAAFLPAAGVGFLLWIMVFVFLPAPVKSYVLAHELTHVLWGNLMGATLHGMKISKSGGSVKLSETNFIVTLAPYFFPLYTMLVIGAYFLASVFVDLHKFNPLFYAAVGFTIGYHLFFTVAVLAIRQSDIDNYGRIFSYAVIYFMNAFIICLLVVAVSPVSLSHLAGRLAADFTVVWGWMRALFLGGMTAGKNLFPGAG